MEPKIENGVEGRECVPFFETDQSQIIFEFFYLVILFFITLIATFLLQIFSSKFGIVYSDKVMLFSIFGGFLGGWVYDAKWFYRVTARGKSDQYSFPWQPHKFYWRVLTPFLSAVVAFSTYLLISSRVIPIQIDNMNTGKIAFSLSFLLGYFSDLVLSRLAGWAEKIVPKVSDGKKQL